MFDFNSKIKNKCASLLITGIFLFVGVAVPLVSATNTYFDKNGFDIIVPDDYSSIQNAIDNASPGDKILVRSGIYKENMEVDKYGLSLIGENKFTTVIDGGRNSKSTVTITSSDVTIQGFSIINGDGEKTQWDTAGISVSSSNVIINENLIMWNRLGINALDIAHNLTICNNMFTDDSILLGNYEYTSFQFTKESFLHTIVNNTVNGKPIYYYKNQDNFTVPNNAGQIILVNCTNGTIKGTSFTHVDFPVLVNFCSHCIIENLTVDETWGEIILLHSENCTIQNNTASHLIYGVCLDYNSKNNVVRYNEVSNNYGGIVVMTSSSGNRVYQNNIHDNGVGVFLLGKSNSNHIFENDIYSNDIGIKLEKTPFDNIIENNMIRRCSFDAISIGRSYNNIWDHNYWGRPRITPKLIFSFKMIGGKIPIPYLIAGFDWHPAKKPYNF